MPYNVVARPPGFRQGLTLFGVANPVGFYPNGSTNSAYHAALARVAGGTGRGRILYKGDSTTVGQGGGTTADSNRLTAARPNRVPAQLAGLFTAAGVPMLDGSFVCDNGMGLYNAGTVNYYDTRVDLGGSGGAPGWTVSSNQIFPGGGLLQDTQGNIVAFHPAGSVDTFEVVYYNAQNSTLALAVDNGTSAIASGPVSVPITAGSGWGKATLKTTSVGTHYVQAGGPNNGNKTIALCSITAYDSTTPAFDIIVDAALGAKSGDQAASGGGWENLDHIGYVAPDLTIINLGINDMLNSVATGTYTGNLQTIVTAAKAKGDVLLVFPHAIDPGRVPDATQASYASAASALAASAGVAFLNLREALGSYTTISANLVDGVHGNSTFYGQVAAAEKSAMQAMGS